MPAFTCIAAFTRREGLNGQPIPSTKREQNAFISYSRIKMTSATPFFLHQDRKCIWQRETKGIVKHLSMEVMHFRTCPDSLTLGEILYGQVEDYLIFFCFFGRLLYNLGMTAKSSKPNHTRVGLAWLFFSRWKYLPSLASDRPADQCSLYQVVLTGGIKCIKGSASSFYFDILDVLIYIMDCCQHQYI